jgi:hypothetical protein
LRVFYGMAPSKIFVVAGRAFAALTVLALAASLWSAAGARAASQSRPGPAPAAMWAIDVIDASTFEDLATATRFRLQNVQVAAVTASCAAERELGEQTAAAALALIGRSRQRDIHPTGRLDSDGVQRAFVVLDGRDLGELLMAQGLVRRERAPRAPWCDSDGNLSL